MVFTANPEDYTARGKIITPLKDRIGAEIRTHYPEEVETGMEITRQEAWVDRDGLPRWSPGLRGRGDGAGRLPGPEDKRIDQRSGVSQRMPITVLEGVVSNAERRALRLGEDEVVPRMGDLYAALPAITGKMELEYEGELQGAERRSPGSSSPGGRDTFQDRAGGRRRGGHRGVLRGGGALQVSDDAGAGPA
jgi:magnesium chelatase subunit I